MNSHNACYMLDDLCIRMFIAGSCYADMPLLNVSKVCLHECKISIACVCLNLMLRGFERLEGKLGLPEESCDRGLRRQRTIELIQNRQACQPIRTLIEDQAYGEDQIS